MRPALFRRASNFLSRNDALRIKDVYSIPQPWNISGSLPRHLLRQVTSQLRTLADSKLAAIPTCERVREEDENRNNPIATAETSSDDQDIGVSQLLVQSSEIPLSTPIVKSPKLISNFIEQTPGSSSEPRFDPLKLEFESDIGNFETIGSKLIDDPRYKHDFDLWRLLLDYRHRHYGDEGVIHIWKGITRRSGKVDLPVHGENADFLWGSFIATSVKQEWLLREVQLYAEELWKRTGQRWHQFYEKAIGGFFHIGHPKKAVEWNLRLKRVHLRSPNDVVNVFPHAQLAEGGLQHFRNICRTIDGHKIYSNVVPNLWKQHRIGDALAMHEFLISRYDGPNNVSELEPLLKYVEEYGSQKQYEYLVRQLVRAGIKYEDESDKTESLSATRKAHETSNPPKKAPFSDDFGARLFATRALTFDLILAGLEMFGVECIGPLTLREMALRSKCIDELVLQLAALKKAGISTGDSVYSKVVVKLAFDRSTKLLEDVLHSDQHPDVFEDLNIQESLLAHYSKTEEWRQVNKTLTIISVTSKEDTHSYNLLFRNAVRIGDWDAAWQQFETMRSQGVHLSKTTILWLGREILPQRRPGRQPHQDKKSIEALRRLIWLYQQAISSGSNVPPEAWSECIKRLGMCGLWPELEKLCFWLIPVYAPRKVSKRGQLHGCKRPPQTSESDADALDRLLPAAHPKSPLRMIFGVRLQEAILAWGFILRPNPHSDKQTIPNPFNESEPLIPWVRGIILLRQLKEQGVIVQTNTVKRVCRARLATLFSEHRESSRPRNCMLRRENPWSLHEIIQDIHKAWGKPLFPEETSDYHRIVNPETQRARHRRQDT